MPRPLAFRANDQVRRQINIHFHYITITITVKERHWPVSTDLNVTEEVLSCWVFVTAPPALLLHVHYEEIDIECDVENLLLVYDGARDDYSRTVSVDGCEDTYDFVTATHNVHVQFRLDNRVQRFAINVTFKAVPASQRPVLLVHYFSEKRGGASSS